MGDIRRNELSFLISLVVVGCISKDHQLEQSDAGKLPQKKYDLQVNEIIEDESFHPEYQAQYNFLLAENFAHQHKQEEAAYYYDLAFKSNPGPYLAYKSLAMKYMVSEPLTLLRESQEFVTMYPLSVELNIIHGGILFDIGNKKLAVEFLKKATTLDPQKEKPYLYLIQAYRDLGQIELAIDTAEKMVVNLPRSIDALIISAYLYIDQKENAKALEVTYKAHMLSIDHLQVKILYGYSLLLNKKTRRAGEAFAGVAAEMLLHAEAYMNVMSLYSRLGGLSKVLEVFRENLKGRNIASSLYEQMVLLAWEVDKRELASKSLQRISRKNTPLYYYLSGVEAESRSQNKQSLLLFEKIRKQSHFYPFAQAKIAKILYAKGDKEKAMNICLSAVKEGVYRAELIEIAVMIYDEKKQYKEAIGVLYKAREEFPRIPQITYSLAYYLEKTGDYESFLVMIKKVIKDFPAFPKALNLLGYVYAKRGENLDEAKQLVVEALTYEPSNPYFLDSLGWILFKQGKNEQALSILLKAYGFILQIKEGGDNQALIMEHLGDVYRSLQQKKKASLFYQNSLPLFSEKDDIKRVENKVFEMKEKS